MHTIKKYLATAVIVATFASCNKDFVDKKPISNVTDGNFYTNALQAEEGLAGAYNTFINGNSNFFFYDNFMNTDGRSDNCYVNGDNTTAEQPLENFTFTSANTNIQRDWTGLYADILGANLVISNVEGVNDPTWAGTTRKEQIIGEAKFIRAMQYYWLVSEWGDCPLITSANNGGNFYPVKSPAATVYAQIIADLKYADSVLLPAPYNGQAGRATKGAADALLAKTYAQMGDYANCLNYCYKVSGSGQYSLLTNFGSLWGISGNNNNEAIFQVQVNGSTNTNWGPELFDYLASDQWPKRDIGSADLIKAFQDAGDNGPRYKATFNWQVAGATFNMPINAWDYTAPIPFMNKMPDPGGFASPDNVMLLRLADIILLAAEANNQLGNTAPAIAELDSIRTRAALPNYAGSNLGLAILNERRLELVHECNRWNDLLRAERNGVIPSIVDLMNSQLDSHGNNLNYNMSADKHQYLFPIPLQDLQLNKNLTQNPGYTN